MTQFLWQINSEIHTMELLLECCIHTVGKLIFTVLWVNGWLSLILSCFCLYLAFICKVKISPWLKVQTKIFRDNKHKLALRHLPIYNAGKKIVLTFSTFRTISWTAAIVKAKILVLCWEIFQHILGEKYPHPGEDERSLQQTVVFFSTTGVIWLPSILTNTGNYVKPFPLLLFFIPI